MNAVSVRNFIIFIIAILCVQSCNKNSAHAANDSHGRVVGGVTGVLSSAIWDEDKIRRDVAIGLSRSDVERLIGAPYRVSVFDGGKRCTYYLDSNIIFSREKKSGVCGFHVSYNVNDVVDFIGLEYQEFSSR